MKHNITMSIYLNKNNFDKLLIDLKLTRKKFLEKISGDEIMTFNNVTKITGYDIASDGWHVIENVLIDHKIEYNRWFDCGPGWTEGWEYFRLVQGTMKGIEISDSELPMYEFLKKLDEMGNPSQVLLAIKDKLKKRQPFEITDLDTSNTELFMREK